MGSVSTESRWAKLLSPGQLKRAVLVKLLGFHSNALPGPSSEYVGESAVNYDRSRKSRDVFVWEEEVTAQLLERQLAPGDRVLDVPVGTGRFIPRYARLDLQITGLDVSEDMLRQARKVSEELGDGSISLVKGSATDLPFPDNYFDAVVSFRFLPGKLTLRSARRALTEYARVARGTVYVLLKEGDRQFPASWRDEFSILGVRPRNELEEILRDSNLIVQEIVRAPQGPKAVFVCRPA